MIKKIINKVLYNISLIRNSWFIQYLRSKGVKIGQDCTFRHRNTIRIDISRPSLITIGDNVDFNMNFQILTHDYATSVFIGKYCDFINSSGRVIIGNNIVFGTNCIVLKGVKIGDNCIIGAGSIVAKDIPANSVAVGRPAKVICSLDDFYARRKTECIYEAFEYANSIRERYKREPYYEEFYEEFHLFVDKSNIDKYPKLPISSQLGRGYNSWLERHKAPFKDFEDFLAKAKEYKAD
ncbi:MAG: acyltransferase [Rikenellaceae bacterium]|nr:acyltransferase [Rikenellaceae bacterium]